MQVLEERLRARSTETEESLQKRLSMAQIEMEYGINIVVTSLDYLLTSLLFWQETNRAISMW